MERRLRFLIRVMPKEELEDPQAFLKKIAKNLGISAVNPKITSYGAIELDLFSQSKEDVILFEKIISPIFIVEFLRDLNERETYLDDDSALRQAVEFFNKERFWEAHEILEQVWRRKEGLEKRLVQGIILTCAAYVHLQKREPSISEGIIKRALRMLQDFKEPFYKGIDISSLKSNLVEQLSTKRISVFKIEFRKSV